MLGVIDLDSGFHCPDLPPPTHEEELWTLSSSLPGLASADSSVWITTSTHGFIWSVFCLEFAEAARLTVDDNDDDVWMRAPHCNWDEEYGSLPGMTLRERLPIAQSVDGFVHSGSPAAVKALLDSLLNE